MYPNSNPTALNPTPIAPIMEGLLAWVKEHISPTASLEETGADDGYRKDDGSWFEPLPSSLHHHQQRRPHSSVVGDLSGDLFNYDLHNLHSVIRLGGLRHLSLCIFCYAEREGFVDFDRDHSWSLLDRCGTELDAQTRVRSS